MNSKIIKILIFLLLSFGILATPRIIVAESCSSTNPCPENYTCVGLTPTNDAGSCEQIGCMSNVICGTCENCQGDICWPIANCDPQNPPSGGGGSCSWSQVNCPAGWTKGGTVVATACGTSYCPQPGTAQASTGCCGNGQVDENGDWFCGNGQVTTYNCCPPGSPWACVINDLGSTYTYLTEPNWRSDLCQENWDQFISKSQSGTIYRTYKYCNGDENPDTNKCNGTIETVTEYYYNTTCQDFEQVCGCTPVCTITNPSFPALLSPSNGASVGSSTVSLVWNNLTQTWGDSCTTNNNQYEVYIGTSPSSLALLGTAGSGTGSASFSGTAGTTYYWKVRAKNGSSSTDSAVWSFTINDGPWWQVKDGDVTTNYDITSDVPDAQLFDIVGLGGYPGVPTFGGTFSLTAEPTKISETVWNANTLTYQSRIFNYSYFDNLIPDDVVFNNVADLATGGSTYTDGYEWFKATGDVSSVGDINIGSRKVILFVEAGNLNINGKINLTDGVGFFGAFVDGNITVSESVTGAPSLEGIYLSDGVFSSGTSGVGDSQLHIRGSVASFGGVNLERDLTNNTTTPAELFEFAPDQMLLFPEKLMFRRSKWQEIAP